MTPDELRDAHIQSIYKARDEAIAGAAGSSADMHNRNVEMNRLAQARALVYAKNPHAPHPAPSERERILRNELWAIHAAVAAAEKRAAALVDEVKTLADAAVIDWALKF